MAQNDIFKMAEANVQAKLLAADPVDGSYDDEFFNDLVNDLIHDNLLQVVLPFMAKGNTKGKSPADPWAHDMLLQLGRF